MAHAKYPLMFSPLTIRGNRLKNRIIMGSMHSGLEDLPGAAERLSAYFVERVKGGVGMIITGGITPHASGGRGAKLSEPSEVPMHRAVTDAVHGADPEVKICMQILHSGSIANVREPVGPSPVRSRLAKVPPVELDEAGIEEQIAAFANCAGLAVQAGYDGVEIIGSAGYLISTFLVERTNQRTDRWGGTWENRMRFAVEVVKRARAALGDGKMLIFRISAMDMLEGGLAWEEVTSLAKALEASGADVISTHFCWHESQVPTIATMVPRAAFAGVTGKLREAVSIPLITSNRINMPHVAEEVLARGDADLISMARPMLADAELVNKAWEGREDEINTCIACNQACLDHTFTGQLTSCLVNARACRETEITVQPVAAARRIAVGGRRAGWACLCQYRGRTRPQGDALRCGQRDRRAVQSGAQDPRQGGVRRDDPLLLADDRSARDRTEAGHAGGCRCPCGGRVDEIVVATGITPRVPVLEGIERANVVSYIDVITGKANVGQRVAIMGAGGIGFDVAEFITHSGTSASMDIDVFAKEWGIDFKNHPRGGVTGVVPEVATNGREVWLLQRKTSAVGKGAGPHDGLDAPAYLAAARRADAGRRGV